MYVYMYVYIYMSLYVHTYVFVCIWICLHIHAWIYSVGVCVGAYQQRIKQVKNRRRRKMRKYLLLVNQDNKGSPHSLHLLPTASHCNALQHIVYTYGTDSICYSVPLSATHLSRWTSPGNTKVLKGLAGYPRQSLCTWLLPQVARVHAGHPLLKGLLPHIACIRARATACGPPRLLRHWCCVWRPRRCLYYADDELRTWCITLSLPAARAWSPAKCNRLQENATYCNRLQQTTTHCVYLRHGHHLLLCATDDSTLQHTATHCNTLQYTATHCVYKQHGHHELLSATDYNRLQQSATCCVLLWHGQ